MGAFTFRPATGEATVPYHSDAKPTVIRSAGPVKVKIPDVVGIREEAPISGMSCVLI